MKKMKKSLSGSVAVLMLLGYNGFGANWQSEYWIAHRTDTNNGDGSLANPYNGTGDGYDTNLLYNIPAKSTIHILPGTYQTHGFGQYQITNGFAFKDGWVGDAMLYRVST